MPQHSAGILLYRHPGEQAQVFLVHPGGPCWAQRDIAAWSIPKGIIASGEDPLAAARREWREETGLAVDGHALALGTFRQPSGKLLSVWAIEGDIDPARLVSNRFTMIWPPRSGQMQSFPEADRGGWFGRVDGMTHVTKGQKPVLEAFWTALADQSAHHGRFSANK